MVIRLFGAADANSIPVWSVVYDSASPHLTAGGVTAFLYVTVLNMNYWADNACEVETWSRFVKTDSGEKHALRRNRRAIPGYVVALPLASGFMVFLGALSTYVTGDYNPIEAISSVTENPVILSVLLLMIVFAQWSTNSVCNLMPSGVCIVALFRSKIPYWLGICICGFIGAVIRPWILIDNIGAFLIITGSLWSTIYGMSIVDFFIIRKRKLNVPDLYKASGGQFSYVNGFNPAGFISFLVGLCACWIFPSFAFVAGAIVSGIVYYFLAKYWVFKKYPQAELGMDGEKYRGISDSREWLYDQEKSVVYPSK